MSQEKEKLSINQIRDIQMQIMDYIDDICKKNGIRYSLSYGTLLGAIRHKGYIPWDDDLDIMMTRTEYERFNEVVKAHPDPRYNLLNQNNNWFPWTKICAANTEVVENTGDNYYFRNYGIWVDIFPYDEVPDPSTEEAKRFHKKYTTFLRLAKIRALKYDNVKKRGPVSAVLFVVLRTVMAPLPLTFWGKRIDNLAKKYYMKNTGFCAFSGFDDVVTKTVRTALFDELVLMDFEDRHYSCLTGYDEYLTRLFNDYMTPPPEDKRVFAHSFDAYLR